MERNSSERNQSPNQSSQAGIDQELLDILSKSICRAGLRLPALVALGSGGPLAFLGGQLLWIAQPALSLFFPGQAVRQVAQVLEDPMAIEALVTRLEAEES